MVDPEQAGIALHKRSEHDRERAEEPAAYNPGDRCAASAGPENAGMDPLLGIIAPDQRRPALPESTSRRAAGGVEGTPDEPIR